ncbi:MAG: prepilin peptidase [Micrococcales bacterium]|nr:prepilin peptidase [Micrococcales bacterium]
MIALFGPLTAVTGAFGLILGSFFNVVIWRVPRHQSVVRPASACPNCHGQIRAYDNIPVISWLLLRGRCRDCSAPISAQYPAVELVTGLAFAVVAIGYVPALLAAEGGRATAAGVLDLVAFLVLAAASVVLSGIDLSVHRLPDVIVLPTGIAGAVLLSTAALLHSDPFAIARAGIGAAVMFLVYFAIAFVKPGAMGFGDVKLAAVLGLFLGYLGWPQLVVGFFAAFVLGGLTGIALILARRAGRRSGIPFGPCMFAGAWVGIFAGVPLARAYLNFVGLG